jgi:phosphoribosyl-ATP pyrophosphohydrolase
MACAMATPRRVLAASIFHFGTYTIPRGQGAHGRRRPRDAAGLTEMTAFTLADLERIVAERASAAPEESWTAKLLAAGPERAAKKLGEEAVEAVIAAVKGDREELIAESADLLYHLLVVLRSRDVALRDVLSQLEARTARSGLAEKAARPR